MSNDNFKAMFSPRLAEAEKGVKDLEMIIELEDFGVSNKSDT